MYVILPAKSYSCLQRSLEASIPNWLADVQRWMNASATRDRTPLAGHLVGVCCSGPLLSVPGLEGHELETKLFEVITVVLKILQHGWYGVR